MSSEQRDLDASVQRCASLLDLAGDYPSTDMSAAPKTYDVRTHGCQMNVHDSERLAGLLEKKVAHAQSARDRIRIRLELARVLEDQTHDAKRAQRVLEAAEALGYRKGPQHHVPENKTRVIGLLIDEVNRGGGRLEIQDSVVHVRGDLPASLLLKLHRHRRHIASAIR